MKDICLDFSHDKFVKFFKNHNLCQVQLWHKVETFTCFKNTSEDQQTTTNKQRLCFKHEDNIEGEVTTQGNTCETWFEKTTWCDDGAMNEHTRNIMS
jgi:hypothetical protein